MKKAVVYVEQKTERDAIRARADAAAAGPWWWGGNVDYLGDVGLRAHSANAGVLDIMRTTPETVDEDSAGVEFDTTNAGEGIDRDSYIQWRLNNQRSYLAFLREDHLFVEEGRDVAIFEVARNRGLPDDTPRSDPLIYRGDVVGVRNANAEFIAHSRADVETLLNYLDEADTKIAKLNAELTKTDRAFAALKQQHAAADAALVDAKAELAELRAAQESGSLSEPGWLEKVIGGVEADGTVNDAGKFVESTASIRRLADAIRSAAQSRA